MKLIYIANARIPTEKAHGIQIMKMCEAFANAGKKVLLIIPWRFNHIKKDPFDYYNVKRNFKIKKLPCIDLIPLDFILGNFALWIQTFSFLIFAKLYLLLKAVAIRGFKSARTSAPCDILYTREQFTGLFFKDFVLEIHSLPKKIKFFHKKIWKKSKKLIVLTGFIKKRLIEIGIPENKILIAPDAVDLEKFDINISKKEARKGLNLPLDKKLILYAGSFYLYDWKGIDVLLESIKYFNEDYLFVLVGGNKKEIKKIQNKYQFKHILLVGHQSHEKIPYYLKASDVLVLPNKKGDKFSEEFTSPLKLFEYMASKRPIVASGLPSIKEILNENNAILVKPGGSESLAKGIEKALRDPDFCAKISKQAYKSVQKYTWNKRVERILRFI